MAAAHDESVDGTPASGSRQTNQSSHAKQKKTERLSVNVSPDTGRQLRGMAAAKVTSVTEIIRRAVAVLSLLEKEQGSGAEIHLVRTDEDGKKTVQLVHLV